MNEPLESDWKKFRTMLPVWRERYLAEKNPRIAAVLTETNQTPTDRFWRAERWIVKEARTLQRCFDDIRRSTMRVRLVEMRGAGVIRREDLNEFSQELQNQVFHDLIQEEGWQPVRNLRNAPADDEARQAE
ncbi:MAG: hypothetical protein JNN01_09755 [Opitutaceae bacterium]|nr:hypothetical protein [Opitutaceae bacterium]